MNAPLSAARLEEIRCTVGREPHAAPGTLALAARELLGEVDRQRLLWTEVSAIAVRRGKEAAGRKARCVELGVRIAELEAELATRPKQVAP